MSDKKIKIYCGWMSTGQSETVHLYLMRNLQERYGDKIELVLPPMCAHRMFHDFARNAVVEEFLDTDCDILWFLDSDICPPDHILDLVAFYADKWQVAGAPYPVYTKLPGKEEMSICFTVYNGVTEFGSAEGAPRGIKMNEVPQEGQEFVDGLATGCLFIKREVFSKLTKPYFEFKYRNATRQITEGEDLGFCLKLHDLGIKCFVDYGMVCKHLKRVCLLDMNNYAIKMSNEKTLEYDRIIRDQVENAVKASYQAGYKKGLEENKAVPLIPKTKSGLILPDHYKNLT